MKFRFIMLGPEDEPDALSSALQTSRSGGDDLSRSVCYEQQGTEMVCRARGAAGRSKCTPLANFCARIVSDVILDDGISEQRLFGLEAEVGGGKVAFMLSAAEFGRMGWVLRQLGPQAIIFPGQQQHVRAAIQAFSKQIHQQRRFTHLGWRKQSAHWIYLHGGGAIGAAGNLDACQVQLPACLQDYELSLPTPGADRTRAVGASLGFLRVAPDHISIPLLAAVYRGALGGVPFGVFVNGPSGVFKSSLAGLCQQHYGARMDARHLPANFASTGNALEWLAFCAKDALLVVDDFAPTGGPGNGELHGVAERLFRAVGNQQGRHRLTGAGRLEATATPRALVLATGEQIPAGTSLRARMLMIPVEAGQVDRAALSACQAAGQQGLLAGAMGAFVQWFAGQYQEQQAHLSRRVQEMRSRWTNGHARTPVALAELQAAWEIFLQFAQQAGGASEGEQQLLRQRGERALDQLAAGQGSYQSAGDAALHFLALLRAAVRGGRAHVVDRSGRRPANASQWGWRPKVSGHGWVARGGCIGWLSETDLFLDPRTSYEAARTQAGAAGLDISAQSLRHRLRQRGLLVSMDVGRKMLQVRRTLVGQPRLVLHLRASDFTGETAVSGEAILPAR
jgi:hypothetical protein